MKTLKNILLSVISITMLLLSGCARKIPLIGTNISPKEALELLKGDSNAVLIDVRTPEEFQVVRIPGSILVPDYEIREKIGNVVPDKKTTVIVYCRSGRRSSQAVKELIDLGYTRVFDLGGIINWPYDTEGEEEL